MMAHLDLRTRDNLASGMSPEAARRDAEARFGDVDELVRRGSAAKRAGPDDPLGRFLRPGGSSVPHTARGLMSDLATDTRFAVRMLRKSPAFTLVAVLSLALGIGFNAAVFAVIDAVLFKPMAVDDPGSLIRLASAEGGFGAMMMSYPDYRDVRDQAAAFEGLAAYRTEMTTFNNRGDAVFVFGESISANFFDVLGLRPVVGRDFTTQDDRADAPLTVMVGEAFWRGRLGADPDAIGSELTFAGRRYVLIGVVPEQYTGGTPPLRVHFWVPSRAADLLVPAVSTSRLERRGSHDTYVIGRLRPGTTVEQADAEVRAIGANLAAEYPDTNADRGIAVLRAGDVRIDPAADQMMRSAAGVLMVIVALVLLIACANIANMMLARASVRRQEIAVRLAIGAGRGRLIRQMLTESAVLSVLGRLLAALVATIALRGLLAVHPPIMVPIDLSIGMAPRVILFTALVSIAAGLLFGLIPALRTTRADLGQALRADEASAGGRTRGNRLRGALVMVQVSITLVLLIGAALLIRSLANAESIDPGIATESIVGVNMGLVFQGYNAEEARDLHHRAMERIGALPGVASVAFAERMPLESTVVLDRDVYLEGVMLNAGEEPPAVPAAAVSPEFFRLMQIPMLSGRAFSAQDVAESPGVAIVNETLGQQLWPGENPIGKRLSVVGEDGPFAEVIGINAPHKILTLGEEPTAHLYLPYSQTASTMFGNILARTDADPAATLAGIRRVVRELDPNLAIMEAKTIEQHLALSLFPVRFAAVALTVLGGLGALLAAVGVYGVVAFAVARRTREIGIRIAVGADRARVVGMVFRQGMRTVAIGAVIGLAISLALTRALGALLYGIGATDAVAFSGAAVALLLAAGTANLLPAWRAARVDPVTALRRD